MAKDIKDIQEEIETLFNARVEECAFTRNFVLEVKFAELTDIFDTTIKDYQQALSAQNTQPGILDLQANAPVIILKNCYISSVEAENNLSDNPDDNRKIGSHFFHRDFFDFGKGEDAPSTVLFNPLNVDRDAPTYYALVDSVQNSVEKLASNPAYGSGKDQVGFNGLAVYQYTTVDEDYQIMHTVNATLGHKFTQAVFDDISDEDKIAIDWKEDGNVVILHSNLSTVAHARPAMGDNINDMSAIDLV